MKLDPEHKECFPFYKKVKKVAKLLQDADIAKELMEFEDCIDRAKRVLNQEQNVKNVQFIALHTLCQCYVSASEPELAIRSCQDALEIRREPGILCDSAEAYLASEMYDDGELFTIFCFEDFVEYNHIT